MVTKQLQKTVNATTVTKTAIDQKQSLEVVQTMLHGALSTLSYLRYFFREEAFDEAVYTNSENFLSYEDYATANFVSNGDPAKAAATRMKILKRNRSKRADMFLDWLENGVFKALKERSLHALQIYVHPSSTDRHKVIEYYTFTVNYLLEADGSSTPTGFLMKSAGKSPVTVEATNVALHALFQQLTKFCNVLPRLPETKFMSMQLFYRNDVAMPSSPVGWIESTCDDLIFGESKDWERRDHEVEELQSGFHRTSISIAHLQNTSVYEPSAKQVKIPSYLEYHHAYNKREDIPPIEPTSKVHCSQRTPEVLDHGTPSTIVESVYEKTPTYKTPMNRARTSDPNVRWLRKKPSEVSSNRIETLSAKALPHASLADNGFDTQSSTAPEMTKELMRMMQPENLTQGDTQIVGRLQPPRGSSDSAGAPKDNLLQSIESDTASKSGQAVLSQATRRELDSVKNDLRSRAQQAAKDEGKNREDAELVRCQCGCSKQDGAMACCAYCKTWQHLPCYGYTGDKDTRIPSNHVCYQCLLEGSEDETLQKLVQLAQRRRGMYFILENGFRNQSDFASETGLPNSTCSWLPLQQDLRGQGYVVAAKNSRRAGYAATGQPSYIAVQDGPNHEKMLKDLFDPLTHIGHHYELPDKFVFPSGELSIQLRGVQKKTMPAPVAPASKRGKTAQAAITGLASPAPPNRPSKRKLRSSRNGLDPSGGAESQPKRRATPTRNKNRPKSLQTQFILDINGEVPSPAFEHT